LRRRLGWHSPFRYGTRRGGLWSECEVKLGIVTGPTSNYRLEEEQPCD
jgi:hypothetical protein